MSLPRDLTSFAGRSLSRRSTVRHAMLRASSVVSPERAQRLDAAVDCIRRGATGALATDALLTWALGIVAAALQEPLVKYLELERGQRWLVVRTGIGWPAHVVGTTRVVNRTTSLAGLTLRLGTPCVCPDLREIVRLTDATLLRQHDVVSTLATGVGAVDRPYGVLAVHTLVRREFLAVDIDFLVRVAAVLADGIRQRGVPSGRTGYPRRPYSFVRRPIGIPVPAHDILA